MQRQLLVCRNPPHTTLAAVKTPFSALRATGHAPRFTLDGSDALERHLERICQDVLVRVLEIVPVSRLEAILLGGGYGRGEGGVLKTMAGDRPYNDLEFYVCLQGDRFFTRRQCQAR